MGGVHFFPYFLTSSLGCRWGLLKLAEVTKYADQSMLGDFMETLSTLPGVHIEFIINTIWLPTSVLGARVYLPPWIITINQKEWIFTYRRLDGSQVELLCDLHHLSGEIKNSEGGLWREEGGHQFHILLLHIAQRLSWSFMQDETLFSPPPATTYNLC